MSGALIAAAAFERDSRAKHYPSMVAGGEMSADDANADWAAWVAIADVIAGQIMPAWTTWDELISAAEKALAHWNAAAAADPSKEERRDWIDWIVVRLRERRPARLRPA